MASFASSFNDEKLLNIIFNGTDASEVQVKDYFTSEFNELKVLAFNPPGVKDLVQTRQDLMCCVCM